MSFDLDSYPDAPRILFVGSSDSSHTHAWIDLLDGAAFNLRLFALPTGTPPDDWNVRAYVTAPDTSIADSETRRVLPASRSPQFWLSEVIRTWQPHIVHTLGFDPAGLLLLQTRQAFGAAGMGQWALQLRGGSDIALYTMNPDLSGWIERGLQDADQILVNSHAAADFVRRHGVGADRLPSWNPVPGTGGVDIDALAQGHTRPSARRLILWPKAYNSPWSLAYPVLEAFRLCWQQLQPCEVAMLAVDLQGMMGFNLLPPEMKPAFRVSERIPRPEALRLMTQARVLLAPSLIDGLPNTLTEAMAAGALPIVSPLDDIRPVVKDGENVLFARNLYPNEIADALVRAMTDDALVDRAAEANLALVRQIGDRAIWHSRVVDFYTALAARSGQPDSLVAVEPLPARDPANRFPALLESDPAALKREYDHLSGEREQLHRSLTLLRQEFADVVDRVAEVEHYYAALDAQYHKTEADLIAAQQHVADYQREYVLIQDQLIALRTEYEAFRAAHSQQD